MSKTTEHALPVAVLVAVPTDEASFRRAWARGSDYLRATYDDCDAGWSRCKNSALLVDDLCLQCRALGAAVDFEATHAVLSARVATFPVVAIVAHASFSGVLPADVVDPSRLLALVASGKELEWQLLRNECPDPKNLHRVIEAINSLLRETHRNFDAGRVKDSRDADSEPRRPPPFSLVRFDRPRLEELCGSDVIAPCAGIELADGMIGAEHLVAAVPPLRPILLDLRMCNSISLGAAVRRARPQTRVAVTKQRARPESALMLLTAALGYMREDSAHPEVSAMIAKYETAMRRVTEALR